MHYWEWLKCYHKGCTISHAMATFHNSYCGKCLEAFGAFISNSCNRWQIHLNNGRKKVDCWSSTRAANEIWGGNRISQSSFDQLTSWLSGTWWVQFSQKSINSWNQRLRENWNKEHDTLRHDQIAAKHFYHRGVLIIVVRKSKQVSNIKCLWYRNSEFQDMFLFVPLHPLSVTPAVSKYLASEVSCYL